MTHPTKSATTSGEMRQAYPCPRCDEPRTAFFFVQRKGFFQPNLSRVGGDEKKPNP